MTDTLISTERAEAMAMLLPGTAVSTSGYPGRIVRQYSDTGTFEVRLASGVCAVDVSDIVLMETR